MIARTIPVQCPALDMCKLHEKDVMNPNQVFLPLRMHREVSFKMTIAKKIGGDDVAGAFEQRFVHPDFVNWQACLTDGLVTYMQYLGPGCRCAMW